MYKEIRLKVLGVPALYRRRVHKSRGYKVENGSTFLQFHFGKRTFMIEKPTPVRAIWNW